MMLVTRKLEFCASHRLHNPRFSDERNREIYGSCNNPNGHGHNYTLEVTVAGHPDPATGMVLELRTLKHLVQTHLIDSVDHKNLNVDVPFLQETIPTLENLAVKFWDILEPHIENGRLYEIRLYESDRNFVVYRGKNRERPD